MLLHNNNTLILIMTFSESLFLLHSLYKYSTMSTLVVTFFIFSTYTQHVMSLYACSDLLWYTGSSPLASLQQTNASFCYVNKNGMSVGNASVECSKYRAYLAAAYNMNEYNLLVNFTKTLQQQQLLSLLLPSISYPIWIGLQRNLTDGTMKYWDDTCQYLPYTEGMISINDANYTGSWPLTYPMALFSDGYGYMSVQNTLPYVYCRKDLNRCGSVHCENNGTCVNYGNCFVCQCVTGYMGQYCEILIQSTQSSSVLTSRFTILPISNASFSSYTTISTHITMLKNSSTVSLISTNPIVQSSQGFSTPSVQTARSVFSSDFPNATVNQILTKPTLTIKASTTQQSSITSPPQPGVMLSTIVPRNTGYLISSSITPSLLSNSASTTKYTETSTERKTPSTSTSTSTLLTTITTKTTTPSTTTPMIHYIQKTFSTTTKKLSTFFTQPANFDGGGLPKWVWFLCGFGTVLGACMFVCACFCFCTSSKKKKSEPFT